jgi:hypothetical protein
VQKQDVVQHLDVVGIHGDLVFFGPALVGGAVAAFGSKDYCLFLLVT